MTKKKLLLLGGMVILCLAICLSAAACSRDHGSDPSKPVGTTGAGTMDYTIEITSQTGAPLEEIGVYVYTDSTMSELVWFAKTDAEGKLSFSDIPSDNFVAVLSGVPAGYLVEEYYPLTGELTQIKLEAGLMEVDLSQATFKLGDLMLDFSVTGPDGTVYKFSELLKQKDAVILNFWYLQCDPCKSEFPGMQSAYEQYSDKVALLAMNPVNQDNSEIEQFRKDNGYTFPMMACDPNWEKAMQITAYPTTVVIDRYGYICLIHWGTMEEESFEAAMDYFTAEDYEHTTFQNIEDLEDAAGVVQTVGTPDNPVQIGSASSFQVTVEPGKELHCEIYRLVALRYLSLSNPNAYVIHQGTTYSGGYIYFPIKAEDTNTPVKVVFGNKGTETQTYTVYLGIPQGSQDNPYSLKLGEDNKLEFQVDVPAGNDQGICYRYPTDAEGTFTVEVISATPGVDYDVTVETVKPPNIPVQRNLSADSAVNAETGNQMVSINAYKDSRITIKVGSTSMDHPAVSVKLLVTFKEGTIQDTTTKNITYSVNVTDENRKPVPGIMLDVDLNGTPVTIITDASGVASTKLEAGTYTVTMREPNGYRARNLTYKLTEKNPSISIWLQTIVTKDCTVKVLDEAGKGLPEAFVSIGNTSLQTDENGVAIFKLEEGSYTATVAKVGYYTVENVAVSTESPESVVTLKVNPEASFIDYTVYVRDYYGNVASGVTVNYYKNGAVIAGVTTGANGTAVKKLEPGDYTVGIAAPYYLASGNTSLTETAPETTVKIVKGITGAAGEFTANMGTDSDGFAILSTYPAYAIGAGATYIELNQAHPVYFFFEPGEASGLYEVAIVNNSAVLSQWSSTGYLQEDNLSKLSINHKDSNNGASYVIGVEGSGGGILLITRVGDFIKDENDIEYEAYVPATQPQKFTLNEAGKLTYVDLSGKTEDYKIVMGSDGVYHLNSATGPKLYFNIGPNAPYHSLYYMAGAGGNGVAGNGIKVTLRDESGKVTKKIDFSATMLAYGECMNETYGIYPLTEDLRYIVQTAGTYYGWWNSASDNFWLEDVKNLNPDLGWMFALCYFK